MTLRVVKVGTSLLRGQEQVSTETMIGRLADALAESLEKGDRAVLVSSGAVGLGCRRLGLNSRPESVVALQAAAAVGQGHLMGLYEAAMARHSKTVAQVLLTRSDLADRRSYRNASATLHQLLDWGVLPIVNENDTIATDEIRYGDNDRLAANMAAMVAADQLVLLSDVDGFYSGNPKEDSAATRYEVIPAITPEIEAMAGDAGSGLSKGGMKTKLMAARTATAAGCAMAITEGSVLNPLEALEKGANATWFTATEDPQTARKHWIAAMKPKGAVRLDAGAVAALGRGKSLLPAGVTRVEGRFLRGDPVAVEGPDGARLGLGLIRYTSDEAAAIAGHQSAEIEQILGYPGRAALIHRDDMAL